jgi:hypothetical protein
VGTTPQKPVHTIKEQLMFFGSFIDCNSDWVDSVHFPEAAQNHQLTGRSFYHLKGKIMEEFGVYNIEVKWMQKIGIKRSGL